MRQALTALVQSGYEEHPRLVKALRKGDGPRAVRLTREHIEGTEHILAGLLPARRRAEKSTTAPQIGPSTAGA